MQIAMNGADSNWLKGGQLLSKTPKIAVFYQKWFPTIHNIPTL